jgi:hypothetical protein
VRVLFRILAARARLALSTAAYAAAVLPYAWISRTTGRRLDRGPQASYWIARRRTATPRSEFERP